MFQGTYLQHTFTDSRGFDFNAGLINDDKQQKEDFSRVKLPDNVCQFPGDSLPLIDWACGLSRKPELMSH